MYKNFILCVFALLIIGCATTDDPRGGGLFGYWATGDEGYKKRLDERQQALNQAQQEGETEKQKSKELETERTSKQSELDQQKEELNALDQEIKTIEEKIKKMQVDTTQKQKEKTTAEKEVKKLKDKIAALKKDTQLSIEEKKKKIDALNGEIKKFTETNSSFQQTPTEGKKVQ